MFYSAVVTHYIRRSHSLHKKDGTEKFTCVLQCNHHSLHEKDGPKNSFVFYSVVVTHYIRRMGLRNLFAFYSAVITHYVRRMDREIHLCFTVQSSLIT